jgi:tRNA (guanine37-N1)-methyltransferase
MRIIVITLFPAMIEDAIAHGVLGRALRDDRLAISTVNPRDFARDRHRTVDDRPYGGGPGMLMKVEPLAEAIDAARAQLEAPQVIYLSPQGEALRQARVRSLADSGRDLVLIAGRYEGIDERIIDEYVDLELSIGDYVLSGGELPALVLIDALARLIPGVLGDEHSAEQDSFTDGLLDYPHYTRPETVAGRQVPDVLIGGDHAAIARWRLKQALGRTWQRRPELIDAAALDATGRALLDEFISEAEAGKA